jgi:hypothetical protein
MGSAFYGRYAPDNPAFLLKAFPLGAKRRNIAARKRLN